jgi:hypothetical protein
VNVLGVLPSTRKLRLAIVVGLAALAAAAYIPAQLLPLIADDYLQVGLGRRFGPTSSWADLAGDALYRCRATSILITYWTEKLFGFSPAVFNATSLLFHALNVLLVAALGCWRPIGWRISIAAAAFFAIAEGHQEAVIWYAALPELLVFTFVISSFLTWVLWLQSVQPGTKYYAASLLLFIAALLSKESAVCLVGLQIIAVIANHRRELRHWIGIVPFGVLSALYFVSAYLAKSTHHHFNDGTFSLHAPFWLTLTNSAGRMIWIWGVVAIAILVSQRSKPLRLLAIMAAWTVVTLLPYSFLTYMPRVPSRHTYLASVALACLVGAALVWCAERWRGRPHLVAALALLIAIHNCGYLWTKKYRQFSERAAPTRELIDLSKKHEGPIYVKCFPYSREIAELAIVMEAGEQPARLHWVNAPACDGHEYDAGVHASR